MKTSTTIRFLNNQVVVCLSTYFLAFSAISPLTALAFPLTNTSSTPHQIGHLPPEHEVIHSGAEVFYFIDGYFYKKSSQGYLLTTVPIGVSVTKIPNNAIVINVDKTIYYACNDAYYQKTSKGFVVVQKPAKPYTPTAKKGEHLQVVAQLLNMRSGPGNTFPIIQQITKNQIVEVQSSSIDWAYVKLPGSGYGWVKLKFTASTTAKPCALAKS